MSALPAWATDPEMLLITEQGYEALPEEVRKQIEVIDGRVVFCRSGSAEHNIVARRLANVLESARPAEPCIRAVTDFEMRSRKVTGCLTWNARGSAAERTPGDEPPGPGKTRPGG